MNITQKNAAKVYETTTKKMMASARDRMKRLGINCEKPTAGATKEYIENAFNENLANNVLFSIEDFLAAKEILGTKKANGLQRKLLTNKRKLIPTT